MSISESLANKYRPKSWAELIGQGAIVSILQRQVSIGKFRHAYLFTGPAGCGKTTAARLLAKDINNGVESIIEIDAASNNGIDTIRAINLEAQQMSLDSDYKVFVLDEAHQLSRAAWDAALKLIEEPPSHVVFIFCTTNPNKIPETILSRVQRFDFKRVSNKDIADRLDFICTEELKVEHNYAALEKLASASNGCVRDALSKLDICLSSEEPISMQLVDKLFGFVPEAVLCKMANALVQKDLQEYLDNLTVCKVNLYDMSKVYSSFLSFVLDYCIYCKCGSLRFGNTSSDVLDKLLNKDYLFQLEMLLKRLVSFERYSKTGDAEVILKTIGVEMAS